MSVSGKADELARALGEGIDMNDLRTRRPETLEEMARALAHPLYRFVARLVGQDADAEDVVQQTFANVVARIDTFRGSADNLRSWVFTIAYRVAMDVLRARGRAVALESDVPAPGAEPVDLETPPAELRRAFGSLDATDQYLLTLKYQDEFSNAEIAGILGVTPNHAGVLLFRAKQHLRKAIR